VALCLESHDIKWHAQTRAGWQGSIRGLKYPRAIARIQDLTPLRKSGILVLGFFGMTPAAKLGITLTGHWSSRTLPVSTLRPANVER
jgi:hypothetical protein